MCYESSSDFLELIASVRFEVVYFQNVMWKCHFSVNLLNNQNFFSDNLNKMFNFCKLLKKTNSEGKK